jgi:hypothetical protein
VGGRVRSPAGAAGLRFSGFLGVAADGVSARLRDSADAGEDGDEVIDPGPGGRDAQVSASRVAGQPGRDVQQPVAQGFGFSFGQWPGQSE